MKRDSRVIWERYVESWRAESAAEKRRLFAQALSPACVYRDPLTEARGYDALLDYMLAFHGQVPGGYFVTESFMAHHDRSIAKWRMVDAQGTKLGEGSSFGEYDAGGLLIAMTGFFETQAPPQ